MREHFIALAVGVVMGGLIQRVRASNPALIARNLRLEDLTIIKFMATTIAVGTITAHLLGLAVPMHFAVKPLYLVGVLAGGLVFGVGFALGGFCPGTCVVGAGEGRGDALWAFAGGLVGALLFTLTYVPLSQPLVGLANYGKLTLAGALHVPAWAAALGLGVLLLAVVALLPDRPGRRA